MSDEVGFNGTEKKKKRQKEKKRRQKITVAEKRAEYLVYKLSGDASFIKIRQNKDQS